MRVLAIMVAVLGLAAGWPGVSRAAEVLISEAEGSLPAPGDNLLATRGITRGPAIEQVSPEPDAKSLKSPLPLKIKFVARNNATVDQDSVKITYLRMPTVDLTARLKAHLTSDGIDMSQAELPPGNHIIRIDLKDSQGRTSTAMIKLSVGK